MLYRILRPDENYLLYLEPTAPNSHTSVFNHVINESSRGYPSPYILTCGSLNSVLELRNQLGTPFAQIVQISEDNLPNVKIDLRTWSNRKNHYVCGIDSNESIDTFNKLAKGFEIVLLVGYVHTTYFELMDESDCDCHQL